MSQPLVVWPLIFQLLNLPALENKIEALPKDLCKGLNSLVILVVWEVQEHKSSCVFEGSSPSIQSRLQAVKAKGSLWCMSGATKFQTPMA